MNENDLIDSYIEPVEDPGSARLVHSGVNVWALIAYLQGDEGDVDRVARAYDIPVEAIHAAIAYYERHRARIQAEIIRNAA